MSPIRRLSQSLGIFLSCRFTVPIGIGSRIAASEKCCSRVTLGHCDAGSITIPRRFVPCRFRRRLTGAVGTFIALISGASAGQSSSTLALQRPCAGSTSSALGLNARPADPLSPSANVVAVARHTCAQPAWGNRRGSYSWFAARWTTAGFIDFTAVYPGTDHRQWRATSYLAKSSHRRTSTLASMFHHTSYHPSSICRRRRVVHQHSRMTQEQFK